MTTATVLFALLFYAAAAVQLQPAAKPASPVQVRSVSGGISWVVPLTAAPTPQVMTTGRIRGR